MKSMQNELDRLRSEVDRLSETMEAIIENSQILVDERNDARARVAVLEAGIRDALNYDGSVILRDTLEALLLP